jgi:hypothetical protein
LSSHPCGSVGSSSFVQNIPGIHFEYDQRKISSCPSAAGGAGFFAAGSAGFAAAYAGP